MTTYQLALLVHLCALLAATVAAALVHFAAARRASAPTLREAMQWAGLLGKTSRVFPLAVLTLIATGAYMVHDRWNWGFSFVQAGLIGALVLLVGGAVLGAREGRDAKRHAARLQQAGRDLPNDAHPDPVAALLGNANTGLALAIVTVMTLKPGFALAAGVLVAGWALGAFQGVRYARAARPAIEESEAEAA